MKILMLGTEEKGGMGSVVNIYLDSDITKQYPIKFIPTHDSGNLIKKTLVFIKALMILPFFLVNKDYKIIHIHFSKSGSFVRKFIIVLLSKIFRKKIIIQTHDGEFFTVYEKYPEIIKKLVRFFFSLSDAVFVLSNIRKEEYSKITSEKKIFVIPNFIGINKKQKKINKTVKIIYLGVLSDKKGVSDLIKAVKLVSKQNFTISIAGKGDLDKYKTLVSKLKLENKISFAGWVSGNTKIKLYAEADIFVLPSYYEDLPMAILEAMSYGLPIVSTNVAGIPEMVKNNYNGYLVKPGDFKTLSQKLKELISNRTLRERLGKNSLTIIKEKYEKSIIEKRIIKIYGDLTKNG